MVIPSPRSQKLTDPEELTLSSFDSDGQPGKLLDNSDEEAVYTDDPLADEDEKVVPAKTSTAKLVLWIIVNTFATIGIVSHFILQRLACLTQKP